MSGSTTICEGWGEAKGPGDSVPGGLTESLLRRSADESALGNLSLVGTANRLQEADTAAKRMTHAQVRSGLHSA